VCVCVTGRGRKKGGIIARVYFLMINMRVLCVCVLFKKGETETLKKKKKKKDYNTLQ